MPFRDKVKKAFGKSSEEPSETNSDMSQVQSKTAAKKAKKQKTEYPDNVYKPGEIPESKYKGPYNKAHQQRLHAFSFGNAFQGRRKSEQSLYSPMGSRLASRAGSFISRRSLGPKSRQQSRVEDTLMENNEADDDVENEEAPKLRNQEDFRPRTRESQISNRGAIVGTHGKTMVNELGKQTNKEPHRNKLQQDDTSDYSRMDGLESTKTLTNDDYRNMSFGRPFSADDLVHAMTQSTLKPSAVQA
ncbi:MAG: hypothetical protein Q9170_000626 [Blastenia crenularia]